MKFLLKMIHVKYARSFCAYLALRLLDCVLQDFFRIAANRAWKDNDTKIDLLQEYGVLYLKFCNRLKCRGCEEASKKEGYHSN
mmetsp:Transcript_3155/g.4957  ORF Transcript_3155/g.4957 Transcript_3155/m.4957 type:complete len:83 (+) Transcript_3155:466-714(+)